MDGIVLLAKQPGLTSFTSLHQIKRAIKSTKVGHTGTLDNFAQGLLVVCTGRLTRLAGDITQFNKTYKAVIKFGTETDTLDYEGEVIKIGELPDLQQLKTVIPEFVGKQMQVPPVYSAIHVDGQRASELARSGRAADLPPREINVFSAELQDVQLTLDGKVEACLVEFSVSKGTYIRSLARDLGCRLGSAAHLVGLFRTKVGTFGIEDAALVEELPPFTISYCLDLAEKRKVQLAQEKIQREEARKNKIRPPKPVYDEEKDQIIYSKILSNIKPVTEELAKLCGFNILHLATVQSYEDFLNGRPLKNRLFTEDLYKVPNETINAVFEPNGIFAGLITKDEIGKIRYKFVVN